MEKQGERGGEWGRGYIHDYVRNEGVASHSSRGRLGGWGAWLGDCGACGVVGAVAGVCGRACSGGLAVRPQRAISREFTTCVFTTLQAQLTHMCIYGRFSALHLQAHTPSPPPTHPWQLCWWRCSQCCRTRPQTTAATCRCACSCARVCVCVRACVRAWATVVQSQLWIRVAMQLRNAGRLCPPSSPLIFLSLSLRLT